MAVPFAMAVTVFTVVSSTAPSFPWVAASGSLGATALASSSLARAATLVPILALSAGEKMSSSRPVEEALTHSFASSSTYSSWGRERSFSRAASNAWESISCLAERRSLHPSIWAMLSSRSFAARSP